MLEQKGLRDSHLQVAACYVLGSNLCCVVFQIISNDSQNKLIFLRFGVHRYVCCIDSSRVAVSSLLRFTGEQNTGARVLF